MLKSRRRSEFCNEFNVIYSKERDERTRLVVDVGGTDVSGVIAFGVGDAFVVDEEDGTTVLRLKANFAFGTDALRNSASATSSPFNCYISIHTHLDIPRKL